MSDPLPLATSPPARLRDLRIVVTALGLAQILAWGSSYYLPAVLAKPIAEDTGWALAWVVGGLSLGLLIAGIVSPRIGNAIERHGGRPVLIGSAFILAIGLTALACAPNLPFYLAAWAILGIGMGAGLYDAAFGTLGRLYGDSARQIIATLTLFGGFASTVCWPLSAYLVSAFGWRGACLAYAALHVCVALPLYVFLVPRAPKEVEPSLAAPRDTAMGKPAHAIDAARLKFVLLAAAITLNSMISAVLSVHLLTILQARDIALAAAVALGALVGPSQVAARAIEIAIGRYHHPIWTMLASTLFISIGLAVLWAGWPVLSAALVFYGAGIGIESIARGTLPLAIFGAGGYAAMMGRLAMPALIAQAASPTLGAWLLTRLDADGTLATLFGAALVDMAIVLALYATLAPLPGRAKLKSR